MTSERWKRIERIYHAALERAPSEQAQYLAEASAGDEALRAEVESLLRYHSGRQTSSNLRAATSLYRRLAASLSECATRQHRAASLATCSDRTK
jgi:hypothetical protein